MKLCRPSPANPSSAPLHSGPLLPVRSAAPPGSRADWPEVGGSRARTGCIEPRAAAEGGAERRRRQLTSD